MQAKKNGTAITVETKVPIVGYLCDTTTEALRLPTQAALIANCPVKLVECTYLGGELEAEALKRHHVAWGGELGLYHLVAESIIRAPTTWVLIHFSLRHSDTEISAFFADPSLCGLRLQRSPPSPPAATTAPPVEGPGSHSPPPLVVLWLDAGIVQLWLTE